QGKTLVTYVPPKEYQFVVFASPELKKGAAYTLYTGGTSTGTLMDGLYTGGALQGGTKVVNFTIANPVTWLNESGITTPQSGMGPGGGRPRK
ncbi:MAG TPA: dockerin type 1, partial [Symbiobacteriaceae bacterium]|nr:dockerin type 1 [Symbiobacteriaceae bacterium]